VVVLLGTPTAESSELYALTVTQGDPSWAGPLAGIAMNLPFYHILEPAIKGQVPAEVYEHELGIALYTLDGDELDAAVTRVRNGS
jgi:glycine/sarcosine/betaine reductase complex component A